MTTTREILTQALKPFGMVPGESGLRFVEDKVDYANQPSVYLALEIAERYEAQAVYLRFFADAKRPPKPEVYVFYQDDFSADKENDIKDQIRKVWNSGLVQQCYFFGPKYARLFNSWELGFENGTIMPKELEPVFEWASISDELAQRYNSRLLDSGLFWETPKGKTFKQEKTAYRRLLEAVKKVRREIPKHYEVPESIANRLLVMTILLRYLEDRGKETGDSALKADQFYPEFTFRKLGSSLADVFRNGHACLEMFERLASKNDLNGEVFSIDQGEHKAIRKIDLEWLALFAEGKITFSGKQKEYGQLSLWEWYSFDYLPIELISHIYEDFAVSESDSQSDASGVVYTPPELVQFLLDEVLPLSGESPRSPRILDPACGSGIFLVGAYKRLIQLWRLDNQWKHPAEKDIKHLQLILSNCIYGCDKNEEAIRLTYFSLNLALLDALSPKDIWDKKVHFQYLTDENLFGKDFFEQADALGKFDIVIGNPPFLSKLTVPAQRIEKKLREEKGYPKLPGQKLALLFLSKSLEMLNPNGKCCLILPSGQILYDNGSHPYRRHLIDSFKFKTVFDFTALRISLFSASKSEARPAVAAVLVDQAQSDDAQGISHVIIRKNSMAEENVAFETDGYDIHWVSRDHALDMQGIWQSNFMGGGRLTFLTKRLAQMTTVNEFISERVKNGQWQKGDGWKEGPDSKKVRLFLQLETKQLIEGLSADEEEDFRRLTASHLGTWITNFPTIITDSFSDTNELRTELCTIRVFERPRTESKKIFAPPHLLIKKNAGGDHIPVKLSTEYLTFRDKVTGIHAPENQIDRLIELETACRCEYSVPLMWILSGQVIGNREGVPVQEDLFALPFPMPEFYEMERVLLEDIAEYQIDFRKNGAKSNVLNPITDRDDPMLQGYTEWYCDVMNSVYKDFKTTELVLGDSYIGMAFYLGDEPRSSIPKNTTEFEQKVMGILHYQHSHQLYVRRMMIVYDENCIFIYKPNQRRYWTRSIAIADADGTFADLVAQGY